MLIKILWSFRKFNLIAQILFLSTTFGPMKNRSDFVVDNLKNVIGFKFFMDQVLILQDPIWPIKLDFRKDKRILINKYFMTFKPFSSFCTEKMVAILAIFMFSCFTNSWNLQIWWFWVDNFCKKIWKSLKSHEIVVNQNSLIFPKI